MKLLQKLQKKQSKLVVGLMSGTSADGVDAVLARIHGNGPSTRIKELAFHTYSYPKGYREFLLKNSLPGSGSVDVICRLNILSAHFFADAVGKIVRRAAYSLEDVDLIGSHGQTIHHMPKSEVMFGKQIRSTLQIGDPATIAKLTGIPTVGDFRTGDMAVGGEGAPLVPYFDYLMLRSTHRNRILLNLGGIANITVLPKNCGLSDVRAFDTGPANMVIDALMVKLFRRRFDRNGATAARGHAVPRLLQWMMSHRYLKRLPPKSTGREEFGEMFVREVLHHSRGERSEDILATATEFTASSVYDQYVRFVRRSMRVDELVVSGGGAHNKAVRKSLVDLFSPSRVLSGDVTAYSADSKEALLFAVLANETISENPTNVPSATGAEEFVVLGKICL